MFQWIYIEYYIIHLPAHTRTRTEVDCLNQRRSTSALSERWPAKENYTKMAATS